MAINRDVIDKPVEGGHQLTTCNLTVVVVRALQV
jgi:hypothetical protein